MKAKVTMARLTKFVAIAVCSMGFSVSTPATSQAGVIPWVYDAVFGPVGSLRYGSAYGPTYAAAGYRGYGYSSYYAPTTTVAYAPYGYGSGGGCNSCGQSTYYTPYASYGGYAQSYYVPSSGCATGNCSPCASGNCSNCTTNSVPTSAGYAGGPVPDSQYNSDHQKIERLNERFDRLEHELRQHRDLLKEKHEFRLEEYRPTSPRTFRERDDDIVRPRPGTQRNESINSDRDKPYVRPRSAPGGAIDDGEENFQLREKPPLRDDEKKDESKIDADKKIDSEKKSDESKVEIPVPSADNVGDGHSEEIDLSTPVNIGPAPEATPEVKRLLERQTAKAVAPRQRAGQGSKPTATSVASKPRRTSSKIKLDSSLDAGIARH